MTLARQAVIVERLSFNHSPDEPLTTLDQEVAVLVRAAAAAAATIPRENTDLLVGFAMRAIELIEAISEVVLNIQRQRVPPERHGSLPFPMTRRWDSSEIEQYLLEPSRSQVRLDDVQSYFVDLARWQVSILAPIVHA
jgi:hypothetical protein